MKLLASAGLGPELASDHNVIAGPHWRHSHQPAQSEAEDEFGELFHVGFSLIIGSLRPQ